MINTLFSSISFLNSSDLHKNKSVKNQKGGYSEGNNNTLLPIQFNTPLQTDVFVKKATRESSKIEPAPGNKGEYVKNDTFFFRDYEELEFIKDYLNKNFQKGTHIADFACSDGEETYSLAMILNDINQKQKYKISGYDISPDIIAKAVKGNYKLGDYLEPILFERNNEFSSLKEFKEISDREDYKKYKEYKTVFNQFFEYAGLEKDYNKYVKEQADIMKTSNLYANYIFPFKIKEGAFDKIVNFQVGNINNINSEQLKLPKNTGVIIFKNAWYHLSGYHAFFDSDLYKLHLEDIDLGTLDKVTTNINKSLEKNGLLVVGGLAYDHIFNHSMEGSEQKISYKGQEIKALNNTPFHEILFKNGFEPVFYENDFLGTNLRDVYLPTIWKKVRNV